VPVALVEAVKPTAQLTIEGLIDRYEQARRERGQDIKSLKPSIAVLRNGFRELAKLPVASFGKKDIRAAHSLMTEGGKHANGNLFLRNASALFNWAIYEDLLETNWAAPAFVKRAKVKARDRVLTMDELAAVWHATERYVTEGGDQGRASRAAYARMVRFLLLTGQRLSEAADLRYGEIVAGLWTQQHNKMERVHRMRLPELAMAQVAMETGQLGARVFASEAGARLNNFDVRMDVLHELSGVTGWSHHTLRHTIVSQLGKVGVSLEVREAVINHKLVGMAGVYNHVDHEEPIRDALKKWADMIAAQVAGFRRAA